MRAILIAVLLALLATGGVLVGGGRWLAAQALAVAAREPALAIGAATPLRDGPRLGVHLRDVAVTTGEGGTARLAALDLWAQLFDPTDLGARLPASVTLDGRSVATEGAALRVRFGPLSGLAMTDAGARAARIALPRGPALADLDVTARLAVLGADAPRGAGASYDLALTLGRADLPALPPLGARGTGRLWLTAAPGRGFWAAPPPPEVVGLGLDDLRLTAGDLSARATGRVARGPDGLAVGRVAILTADAGGFLDLAVGAGAIARPAALIARGVLNAAGATVPPADWPAPRDGERLIPLEFREGRTFLGSVAVGPAPAFP